MHELRDVRINETAFDRRASGSKTLESESITGRAARLVGLARDLRMRAETIHARVIRDTRDTRDSAECAKPPSPDHLVFSLSEIENEIAAAISALSDVQNAL